MNPPRVVLLITLLASLSTPMAGCGDSTPPTPELRPFRDDWKKVVDTEFEYLGPPAEGSSSPSIAIESLSIGGALFNDNFLNRGDVVVQYVEMDEPRIRVWMRRFAFAGSKDVAQQDWEAIVPWTFSGNASQPRFPDQEDTDLNCALKGWMNACGIRVAYDGQLQKEGTGADLWVELPAGYRQKLTLRTGDLLAGARYFNRGNICVQDFPGTGEFKLESGNAFVSLADDTLPAPKCSDAQIEACENYKNSDEEPQPWAQTCGCSDFGRLAVETTDVGASNITIAVPPDLWVNAQAQNSDTDLTSPEDQEFCSAVLDIPGIDLTSTESAFDQRGEANNPGEQASKGAGYTVLGRSYTCAPVKYVENPEDFDPEDETAEPASEVRGRVQICTDCLPSKSCTELLDIDPPDDL